jgi:hypothetical protein
MSDIIISFLAPVNWLSDYKYVFEEEFKKKHVSHLYGVRLE